MLGYLGPQPLPVVVEGARPAARMGLRRTAPPAAPPLPEFLNKGATDTKALGNRPLRLCPSLERLDDPVTKVLRVGFHTRDYTSNGPYKQLQSALEISLRVANTPPRHAHEGFATGTKSAEEPGCVGEVC